MPRAVTSRTRIAGGRPLRRLLLLGASSALLTVQMLGWGSSHERQEAFVGLAPTLRTSLSPSFSGSLARPARAAGAESEARPDTKTTERVHQEPEAEHEAEAQVRDRKRTNATELNFTLQLGDGFPVGGDSEQDLGPSFVKCHVMYPERSDRDEFGSVVPRTILEDWVMQGSSEHVAAFKSWRQELVGEEMDVRCTSLSPEALANVQCLACVPRTAGLPRLPAGAGQVHASQPGTLTNTYVMTIHGVDHCLAGSFASSRFCKSGSVALAF